jgi:6-phosphogluconolactonase (cycloisomerase 2 family)
LTIFKVAEDFTLNFVTHLILDPYGIKWPRNFCLVDDKWILIAGQHSDNIGVFKINGDETMTFMSKFDVPCPVCVIEV